MRCSNAAAIKLYSGCFSYRCVDRLSNYYEDGEDAWLMTLKGLQDLEKSGSTVYYDEEAGVVKVDTKQQQLLVDQLNVMTSQ